jgi:hypothetical protein
LCGKTNLPAGYLLPLMESCYAGSSEFSERSNYASLWQLPRHKSPAPFFDQSQGVDVNSRSISGYQWSYTRNSNMVYVYSHSSNVSIFDSYCTYWQMPRGWSK